MAPPTGDAAPAKKRRSFFSSRLNITPNLPAATASRAPIVTSSEVLAALSAPEEVVVVKRREPKLKPAETGTPSSTHGTPGTPTPAETDPATTTITSGPRRAVRVKPSPLISAPKDSPPLTPTTTGTNGHASGTANAKAGRSLRARPSIQYSELDAEDTKGKAPLSPPLTSSAGRGERPKRLSHTGLPASSTSTTGLTPATTAASGSGSSRGRQAAKNGGGVAHAPLLRTPTMASRRGYKPPPETSGSSLPNTTGKRGGKNAQHAQSVNERLSQMMLANIRATIGGREEPSPVRGKGTTASPRIQRTKAISTATRGPLSKLRKTQTTMAMTARQKAKVKAEKQKKLRGKGKKVAKEEDEEDEDEIMDDDEDEGFEDLTSSDDNEPATGKGRKKRARVNGRFTKVEKGKGRAKDLGVKDVREKRGQQPDDSGAADASLASTSTTAPATSKGKQYMKAGFYCQDANAKSPYKLVSKILGTKKGGSKRTAATSTGGPSGLSFPPLPYDHGYEHFFGREHDFVLPFNIHNAASSGALNDKKKPAPYQKVRGTRVTCERVICNCAPDSGCGDNCINRIMSYLCGRDCPCGEGCTNRSLAKRTMAETKVKYTGARGFGLFAMQDIKEGDFVMDYRGEVISLDTFHARLVDEYTGQRNFYALAYDQDEVIDSGMKGNDARFINHGCDPNIEVRKYQQVGDGLQEYEVGMWALKDIKQGDELFYDYNFDWFAEAKDSLRAECRCGADSCIGVLGRRTGDKTPKELAAELEAKRAAEAVKTVVKGKRGPIKKIITKKTKKTVVTTKLGAAIQRAKLSAAQAKVVEHEPEDVVNEETSGGVTAPEVEPAAILPTPISPSPEPVLTAPEPTYVDPIDIEGEEEIDELDSDDDMDGYEVEGENEVGARASVAGEWENIPESMATNGAGSTSTVPGTDPRTAITDGAAHPAFPAFPSTSAAPLHHALLNGRTASQPANASSSSAQTRPSIFAPTPEFVPDPNMTPEQQAAAAKAAAAAAKRKSGWTSWLRKIAAEKDRTLEEWHEERIKRRRGIAWMNMMIAEFGVAPSPIPLTADAYSDGRKPAGSVASFANTLAAQGHGPGPQAVKNLGGPKNFYRSDNWGKTREENMRYVGATPAPDSVRGTPAPSTGRSASASAGPSASGSGSGAGWHNTPGSARSPTTSMSSSQGKRPRVPEDGAVAPSKRSKAAHETSVGDPVRPWGHSGDSRAPMGRDAQLAGNAWSEPGEQGQPNASSSATITSRPGLPAIMHRPISSTGLPGIDHPRTSAGSPSSGLPRPMTGQHGAQSSNGWDRPQSERGQPSSRHDELLQLEMRAALMEERAHERGYRSHAELMHAEATETRRRMEAASQSKSHEQLMEERTMEAGHKSPAESNAEVLQAQAAQASLREDAASSLKREADAAQPKPKSLGPFWKTAPTAADSPLVASPATRAAPPAPGSSTVRAHSVVPTISSQQAPTPAAPMAPIDLKPAQVQTSNSAATVKPTEKKIAIAKRNGAPMGWAYEPVEPVVPNPAAVPEELGRGARRARQSLPAGA